MVTAILAQEPSATDGGSASLQASANLPTEILSKTDTTTGNGTPATPILASVAASTGAGSKRVRAKSASASTTAAAALTLLQSDLFDLQKLGFKVLLFSKDGKLRVGLELEGHQLSEKDGLIYLDGMTFEPVGKAKA